MYNCGVEHDIIVKRLLSDDLPSRNSREPTFSQGDPQVLKYTLFNCVVISDESLLHNELKKISDSIRNNSFLESSTIFDSPKDNGTRQKIFSIENTLSPPSTLFVGDSEISKKDLVECENDIVVRPSSETQESTPITSFGSVRDRMIKSFQFQLEDISFSDDIRNPDNYGPYNIFHDGLKYLGEVLNNTQLTSIVLDADRIGNDWITTFAQHLRNSNIKFLSLKNNIFCEFINYVESDLEDTQTSSPKLCQNIEDNDNFDSIVQSTENVNLTTLYSSFNDTVKNCGLDLQAVAEDSHLILNIFASCLLDTKITSINLSCSSWREGIVHLASVLKNTQITTIDLSYNCLNCESLKILAPCLLDTKLTSISLAHNFCRDGIVHLASVLKNTRITSIDLSDNDINGECLKVLASCLLDSKITDLNLSHNKLKYDDILNLAPVIKNTQISSIDLSNNDLSCESLKVLSPCMMDTKVTSINLGSTKLDFDGLLYLSSALNNTNITCLDISDNDINCKSLEVFAPCLIDSKIKSLNLSNNRLSHDGILYLASVIKNTNISSLDLSENDINCESMKEFARCLRDTKIVSINLSNNKLSHDGIGYLASGLKNSEITRIDLSANNVNCKSLEVLASCIPVTNITELNLSNNYLGYEGIICLASALKSSKVISIDLSSTSMNHESLKVFAQCLVDTKLTTLNLSFNGLACNSLKTLVLSLQNSKITTLDLSYNSICCNAFYLSSILKQTHIHTINLSGNIRRSCPNICLQPLDKISPSLDLSRLNLCSITLYNLVHVLKKTELASINLSYNLIDSEDLKYLSQGLLGTGVISLDVSNTKIDCNGVRYLAQVLRHTQISSLNLSNNEISSDGLKFLAQGLQGSKVVALNLSCNPLQYESLEYLAECLGSTEILELDIHGMKITRKAALHVCEIIGRCNNSITVFIDFEDDVFSQRINLFRYPDCCIEINQPSLLQKGVAKLINKVYKHSGIMKLIFDDFYSSIYVLVGAFDNIRISEIELIKTLLNSKFVSIFEKSMICEWNGHCALGIHELESSSEDQKHRWGRYHAYPLKCVPKKKVISLHLQNMATDHFLDLSSALTSNITYLNLSGNRFQLQFDYEMKGLVEALKNSQVISLNISHNEITDDVVAKLAKVLPQTKVTYIDLHGNHIGYSGFRYIMDAIDKTNICWLSLGDNNIEEECQENIELSPFIVTRDNTPSEFHMRYLFKELVCLNTCSKEFEFTVPREDSHLPVSIKHYPRLLKMLLEIPNSNVHIYDNIYMKNKRHNIHVLHEINMFIKEMAQRFSSFIGYESPLLEQVFSYDSFVELVKECHLLELNDCVEHLLLHRVLYYIDDDQEILHPFIYKMLDKHSLPLFNERIEPNKRQWILDYFSQHPEIDDAAEGVALLVALEPATKRSRLN